MAAVRVCWQRLSGSGTVPTGRSSHAMTVVGRKVLIFGGENTPRVPVGNDVHCFNLDERKWSKTEAKTDDPCGRVAGAVSSIGNTVYLFGGRTGTGMGEGALGDFWAYDVQNQEWSAVEVQGALPEARSFHSMTSCGSKLYIFGGCDAKSGRLNDLYCYDSTVSTWEKLPTNANITGRGGPGLITHGNFIFVIAGFTGKETSDMYMYDIKEKTWTTIEAHPNIPPISVFACSCLGSKIFLFGGETSPSDEGHSGAGQFSKETYCYDVTSVHPRWQKVEATGDVPSPRGWMSSAVVSDNELVVFGGNSQGNTRLNDLYLMTVLP